MQVRISAVPNRKTLAMILLGAGSLLHALFLFSLCSGLLSPLLSLFGGCLFSGCLRFGNETLLSLSFPFYLKLRWEGAALSPGR